MRRTTNVAVCALLPGALALAACSGSSSATASGKSSGPAGTSASSSAAAAPASADNAGLTSNQLIKALDTAFTATSLTAVHVTGTINDQSFPWTVDLQLSQDTASGTILDKLGSQYSIISTTDTTYLQATSALLKEYNAILGESGATPTSAPAGSWIPSTSDTGALFDGVYATDFESMSAFLSQWQSTMSAEKFTPDGTGTVDGRAVAFYHDSDVSDASTWTGILAVPLTGPALPVQEVVTSPRPGTTTFTWNQPVPPVTAPPAGQIYSGT